MTGLTSGEPLLGLWVTYAIGRRSTMMLAAFVFMASTIGCALAGSIHAFALWRFVGGMGVGLAMISSPIYIAELAPPAVRGSLVNVNQLSNVIGINLAVVVAYLFSGYDQNWRLMLGSQAIPVLCLMLGLLLVPESPRWLASKGRTDEAMKVLTRINGPSIARQELEAISADVGSGSGRFSELWQPSSRMALKRSRSHWFSSFSTRPPKSSMAVLLSEFIFPGHRTEFVVDLPHAEPSIAPSGLRLVE